MLTEKISVDILIDLRIRIHHGLSEMILFYHKLGPLIPIPIQYLAKNSYWLSDENIDEFLGIKLRKDTIIFKEISINNLKTLKTKLHYGLTEMILNYDDITKLYSPIEYLVTFNKLSHEDLNLFLGYRLTRKIYSNIEKSISQKQKKDATTVHTTKILSRNPLTAH